MGLCLILPQFVRVQTSSRMLGFQFWHPSGFWGSDSNWLKNSLIVRVAKSIVGALGSLSKQSHVGAAEVWVLCEHGRAEEED